MKSIDFVDQARAYELFKETFKDAPDLVKNTSPDALPESFVVKLQDPKKFDVVSSALSGKPGVDSVQDEHAFLNKLFAILNQLRVVAIVISATVIIAAVVLIGVAVQVSAASRKRETGIMRLVGASNLYIQLPFLLEGIVGGLARRGGRIRCPVGDQGGAHRPQPAGGVRGVRVARRVERRLLHAAVHPRDFDLDLGPGLLRDAEDVSARLTDVCAAP